MFKINQKRIIKLTALALAVAMVAVGSVACSKSNMIKSNEYETSTSEEQTTKEVDSTIKESVQDSKVEIDLSESEVNTEEPTENSITNEQLIENNIRNEYVLAEIHRRNELRLEALNKFRAYEITLSEYGDLLDQIPDLSINDLAYIDFNAKYVEYKEGDPKPNTNDINQYRDWLDAQNKHPQGTDRFGFPFKQEGAEYTWSAHGEPNEAPTDGQNVWKGVQNPNTGVKYNYTCHIGWIVDDTEERRAEQKRMNDLMNYGGVDERTGEVYRKLTPEELKEIARLYTGNTD